MKLRKFCLDNQALTLLEVAVVIFSLFMLIAILLPALGAAASKRNKIGCTNNLKQIGLGFRLWEGDNNDRYPASVSATNGGAMEFAALGNAEAVFQVMSNSLGTPILLVCPADRDRWPALSFNIPLTSSNLSYFINPDSSEVNPQEIMTGDDNLGIRGVRVKSGLLTLTPNLPIKWTAERHGFSGNVAMADGSVQGVNNRDLTRYLLWTNAVSRHLAIP